MNIQHFLSFLTCNSFGRNVLLNDIFVLLLETYLTFYDLVTCHQENE